MQISVVDTETGVHGPYSGASKGPTTPPAITVSPIGWHAGGSGSQLAANAPAGSTVTTSKSHNHE